MRIKQFVEATGLSRTSVRFYERIGLIAPEATAQTNGYREYGRDQIERARAIQIAQGLGFSLKEIKALVEAWEDGRMDRHQRRAVIVGKRVEVEEKLATLRALHDYLGQIVDWIDTGETGQKPVFGSALAPKAARRTRANGSRP